MNKVQIAMWALINHLEGAYESNKDSTTFYLKRLRKAIDEESIEKINLQNSSDFPKCKVCNLSGSQTNHYVCIYADCPSKVSLTY